MTDILMPALSPTMEEGTLAKWHVKAGDTVTSGDVIAEIETDKATMEVEAVDEGVVDTILVPEGAEGVKVNTPIARLKGEGEAAAVSPSSASPTLPPKGEDQATRSSPSGERGPRSGGGGAADAASADDPRAARDQRQQDARAAQTPPSAPAAPARVDTDQARAPKADDRAAEHGHAQTPAGQVNGGDAGGRIFASPLARRVAAQRNVDLAGLKGSGPHGRIVLADVDSAKAGRSTAPPAADAPPAPRAVAGPAKSLEQMGVAPGSYDLQPLDGMRKTIAKRMTESFRDVPHFPLTVDLEIDRLLDARGRINAALYARGVKVSVNDILIKASALALKAVPAANASYSPEGIALHHHADVAVAVAIDGGLITPIVRAAETRTLSEISVAMKDMAERARTRKLKPEEYQGGTFSLSNLGMLGIKSFASILNEPQGMILSVGAGDKRAVVRGDQLAIATVMTVTLTCDHRVVDGATGARWLQAFKALVEDPVTMLA